MHFKFNQLLELALFLILSTLDLYDFGSSHLFSSFTSSFIATSCFGIYSLISRFLPDNLLARSLSFLWFSLKSSSSQPLSDVWAFILTNPLPFLTLSSLLLWSLLLKSSFRISMFLSPELRFLLSLLSLTSFRSWDLDLPCAMPILLSYLSLWWCVWWWWWWSLWSVFLWSLLNVIKNAVYLDFKSWSRERCLNLWII